MAVVYFLFMVSQVEQILFVLQPVVSFMVNYLLKFFNFCLFIIAYFIVSEHGDTWLTLLANVSHSCVKDLLFYYKF